MDGQPLPLKEPKERFIVFKIVNVEWRKTKDESRKKANGRMVILERRKTNKINVEWQGQIEKEKQVGAQFL